MKLIVIVALIVVVAFLFINYRKEKAPPVKSSEGAKMLISDESSRETVEGTVLPEMRSWIIKTFGQNAENIVGTIKRTGKIYVPAVGMKESFLEDGKPRSLSDLKEGIHMALITAPDGREIGQAAGYTDLDILNDREFIRERNAHEWFREILEMPDSEGVVINPKTRFLKEDYSDYYTTTNKFGVAELIGMLEVNEIPDGKPYHQLANEAFERGEYYKVLYFWSNSYKNSRPGDDWKKCEISKLKSYYALTFPGSKARSVSELDWMIQNHPGNEILEYAKTAPRQ